MPDGVPAPVLSPGGADDADVTPAEARLLRRTRIRLALWSGGITLAVLVALGVVLYLAVDRSLTATGTAQLVARANELTGGRPEPEDLPPGGFIFGGPGSGTFSVIADGSGRPVGPGGRRSIPEGIPVMSGIQAVRATHERDIRNAEITTTALIYGPPDATSGGDLPTEADRAGGVAVRVETAAVVGEATVTTPIRVLTDPVAFRGEQFYLQVIGDRTTEERTLQVLVVVLVVGGILALLVATAVGAAYASRALVPIRRSLVAQRAALQRQREFAADASHELRTPLTVIRSSVDDLERHRDEPVATVGAALADIRDEVDHLTGMVDDLLLLARSDSGAVEMERVPMDMGDVAADAASALARAAADHGVEVTVDPEPAEIDGDPARIRQLVMILVDNAIRHSPTGGRVAVRVRSDPSGASLVVEDEGPGIRPEDLPYVFDRFYRAAGAPGGGTGLGLAIASWIVSHHGGRVEAANRVEGGARFTVTLPRSGRPSASR